LQALQRVSRKNAENRKELLSQFQKVEKLPNDKKMIIKELIEAFLFKSELQQKLAH
jgi:hypothetical protein